MTFEDILDQAISMLQRRGRLTYRTLQRQFQLDEATLEDLKEELIYGQRLAVDEEGRVLVWSGVPGSSTTAPVSPPSVRPPLAYTPPYLAEKILTSRSALEGERKQVTVLFADLKGSMELLAERDPEDARQLLDPVLEHMMEAVHRYEGTVNQVMGDGIMALFGAPIAHEDHAVRACYTALRMQETVKHYAAEVQRTQGVPIHMRVGLNAGEVVVRALGSDLYMDYTAVGQTTHLAAQHALALATAGGDVAQQAEANHMLGLVYYHQGDYRRAIDCGRQTVAALGGERRRERFGQFVPLAVQSRALLAWCHTQLGTFAEGRACGDEGLRIAEEVDHPGCLMRAFWGIALLVLRRGDLYRALPLLERAMGLCQDAGVPLFFPLLAADLGSAYTLAGRVADAVPLLTQAIGRVGDWGRCHVALGEAQMLAGHLEEAHALAEQALALTRERQQRGLQAYALRLLGDIAARREPLEHQQAKAHYQQALALAEELGMRPLQAHCHCGLGMLYATSGQQEQARAALSTAMEMYRTMGMTFWVPQVEAALA
jgi:class 3 adenylate cyclase